MEYNGLNASLTKVTEELADMRTSMAWLFEEIKLLKEAAIPKPAADVTADVITLPAIMPLVSLQPLPCQIWSKSVKLRPRYGDFSIFQDGDCRHLGFLGDRL